jgi:phage terminase Nu1 subunit (DNA packaging protein)
MEAIRAAKGRREVTNLKRGADVGTVARVINVTPRHVQWLTTQPGFPARYPDGSYDLPNFTLAYMRSLQSELARRGDSPEPAELRRARLSLLRAQAARVVMANRVTSGELREIVDVTNAESRRILNCRERLRAIPSSTGITLTNKADPAYIVGRLQEAIELALAELDGADWSKSQ